MSSVTVRVKRAPLAPLKDLGPQGDVSICFPFGSLLNPSLQSGMTQGVGSEPRDSLKGKPKGLFISVIPSFAAQHQQGHPALHSTNLGKHGNHRALIPIAPPTTYLFPPG